MYHDLIKNDEYEMAHCQYSLNSVSASDKKAERGCFRAKLHCS